MKKVFTLVAVSSLSLVACGPSAEEIAAKEKAKQDSIAAYNEAEAMKAAEAQRVADSTKAFEDAKAAEAQRVADSIANYKPTGSKPVKPAKTIEEKKKDEAKKAVGGRG